MWEGRKEKFCYWVPLSGCLARLPEQMTYPVAYTASLTWDKSADLEGRVNTSSIAVFQINCCFDRESLPAHEDISKYGSTYYIGMGMVPRIIDVWDYNTSCCSP